MKELIKKINELKKQKNAVILVHNYQRPEIYDIADFLGDSLGLSKEASKTNADIIVYCGVTFMAETAKILSPSKKVLIPDKNAICPMACMATALGIKEMRKKHPKAAVVSYVNSTADVKAESDICCTSANAVKIVNYLEEDEVIFVPDINLGKYVQTKTDKKIILWDGNCYVHSNIIPDELVLAKKNNPDAVVYAHPECSPDVLQYADEILSTSGMIDRARASSAKEFIIVTECGMVELLSQKCPGKKFYSVGGVCFQQKKITLEKVYDCLKNETNEVNVDEEIMVKSRKALERMINVG